MEFFPDDDVAACFGDVELQRKNPFDALEPDYQSELDWIRLENVRISGRDEIQWIYFSSPDRTWRNECGRAGWMLYDPESGEQIEYLEHEMS